MYLEELQAVLDAIQLVDDYHGKSAIKELVKTRFVYKDNVKPVTAYINSLIKFSPYFYDRWVKTVTQGKEMGPRKLWSSAFKDSFQIRLDQFLEECYANQPELKGVLGHAIASYTSSNRFSPEQLAYLRQIQSLPPESQRSAIVDYIKKEQAKDKKRKAEAKKRDLALHPKGIYGAKLTPEELEELRKVSVPITGPAINKSAAIQTREAEQAALIQKLDNLGQPLPQTTHTPAEMEVIHTEPKSPTSRQATMPISQIRAQAQNLASRGRQILRPAGPIASEAASRVGVAAIRIQPVKQVKNLGSYFLNQLLPGGRNSASFFTRSSSSIARGIFGFAGRGVGAAPSLLGRSLLTTPAGWTICILLALVALPILFSIFNINDNATLCPPWLPTCPTTGLASTLPQGSLILVKTGTDKVSGIGQDITYTLTVTYTGSGHADADITDQVPAGTQFKESVEGKNNNGTVSWTLTNLTPNQPKTVSFIVTTIKDTFWAVNKASATYKVITPSIPGGGPDLPPNQENCAGKSDFFPNGYKLKPDAGNFGDPGCTMTRDGLILALQKADPVYWKYIFDVLIPGESIPKYNPNSHSTQAELKAAIGVGSPDPDGVWGLFSMGRGKNGQAPLDHGDVNWQNQVINAVAIKNLSKNKANPFWDYWQAARDNPPPIIP